MDGYNEYWNNKNCSVKLAFVCEGRSNVMGGAGLKNLTFTKDQLDISSLVFGYRYKAAEKEVFEAWEDKRMTGFRLNWFIQDINGTQREEQLPARTQDWK